MIEDLSVLIFTNDIVSLPHYDRCVSVTEFSVQTLIDEAILEAKNLRTLSVEVGMASWKASRNKFSEEEAREMMIRDGSKLREIRVAGISYKVRHALNSRRRLRLTRPTGLLGTSHRPRKRNHIRRVQGITRRWWKTQWLVCVT